MLVSGVITRVRDTAGDLDANQFTDEQLVNWINDGIRECSLTNNLLQKRISQNTSVGQSDYSLPSDILKIHSIKFDNDKLKFITLDEFDSYYPGTGSNTSSDPSYPSICYVWAGILTIYPAPSETKPLVIDYIYSPAEIVVGNLNIEVPLPVGYHSRIVDYCLAQVAQQDDDINRYQAKMQEFYTGVQTLKDQPETQEDKYPFINVSPRDTSSDWEF